MPRASARRSSGREASRLASDSAPPGRIARHSRVSPWASCSKPALDGVHPHEPLRAVDLGVRAEFRVFGDHLRRGRLAAGQLLLLAGQFLLLAAQQQLQAQFGSHRAQPARAVA